MDFKDMVYVVTGTHSGIGKACADLLLEQEAYVIGIDRDESSINHPSYLHYSADVKDEKEISDIFDDISLKYNRIDGLANCAGIFTNAKPFYELSLEDWNRVIETNLTGSFLVAKYAARRMILQEFGNIVNISCIRSGIFKPNMAEYAASKGGVAAMTSAMALDLAPYNIRVNCVAPGFTYTGMTSKAFDNPEIRKASDNLIPIGRIAMPEDIAKVILFLLSDMSGYINGETIFADGGYKISK